MFRCIPVLSCKPDRQYYDKILKQVQLYPCRSGQIPLNNVRISRVWNLFCQDFIDNAINDQDDNSDWKAVPGLNPYDFPCYPGSLILAYTPSFLDIFKRRKRKAFFAGTLADFYPSSLEKRTAAPHVVKVNPSHFGHCCQVFQAFGNNKAVIFSADTRDVVEIGNTFNTKDTFLDLSNFEYTSLDHRSCYVVTKIITVESLKIQVTQDGIVYYESIFEGPTPICFQLSKVRLCKGGTGALRSISPLDGRASFLLTGRRGWHNFFTSFIPNQEGVGKSVGDFSAVTQWVESPARQYFRPNYLCKKTGVIRSSSDAINMEFECMDEYNQLYEKFVKKSVESIETDSDHQPDPRNRVSQNRSFIKS